MKIKLYKYDILVAAIVILTTAKMIATLGLGIVSYLDEAFEIAMLAFVFVGILLKRYTPTDMKVLALSLGLLLIGLLGNILFEYQTDVYIVVLDIIATFKGILYFYGIKAINFNENQIKNIITRVYGVFYLLVKIMVPFAILNLFVDIGMSYDVVWGIRGFKFVDTGEGNLALAFYPIVTCLVCKIAMDRDFSRDKKKAAFVILIMWCATLRIRSIGFALLFAVLAYYLLSKNRNEKARIKFWHLALAGGMLIFIARDKIMFYFGNTKTARFNLIKYGLVTLKRFFPIGSGFSTYGSDMAFKNYSKLYREYDFNSVFGLAEGEGKFANDGIWGEIFGQFGFVGTIMFVAIFSIMFWNVYKSANDKFGKFAVIYIVAIMLVGSVGTKTVMHYVVVPSFMLLALLSNYYKKLEKRS